MLWDRKQQGVPEPGWPAACGEGEKKSSDEGFCQQINVNVSWAAFHVVSRIEEEV